MINEKREMINEKLDFYVKSKEMIHIELNSKRFLNARVIEKIQDGVYLINERLIGLMHLFSSDIYNISVYVEGKL